MTNPGPSVTDRSQGSLVLWVLLAGNLIIGTGVLLPAGLLVHLTYEFAISDAVAGYLMLAGGIVVGLGAPLVAAFTSSIDRRVLLTFALCLYGLGHFASALAPNFTTLLIIRVLMIAGAAIFTPQAAATIGLLVPAERRASAIAFIFIGWSTATVVGIPLGNTFAALFGWRSVYVGMGVACMVVAFAVWQNLRQGLYVPSLNLLAWIQALRNPAILAVLLVTLLSMSGQFTVFAYFSPILIKSFQAGPEMVSIAFAVSGVFGIAGNAIASRVVGRIGVDRVIAAALICLICGIGLLAAVYGLLGPGLMGIALWGLGSFSSNSLQQSRLVGLAPPLASATIALNTSVVYLGQAVGAYAGGIYADRGLSSAIAWTACGFTLAALLVSLLATRIAQQRAFPN